jgi:hypothetical protein
MSELSSWVMDIMIPVFVFVTTEFPLGRFEYFTTLMPLQKEPPKLPVVSIQVYKVTIPLFLL